MFVTQCFERSLHRTRATPATAPVWDDLRVLLAGVGTAIDADPPSLIALAK